ncbi:hypothetical protein HDU96_003942 [Phlyctochytrium bullatum]|nr:hypothetical protein HDU96_003942 [Phlyctochytrium bullatum]
MPNTPTRLLLRRGGGGGGAPPAAAQPSPNPTHSLSTKPASGTDATPPPTYEAGNDTGGLPLWAFIILGVAAVAIVLLTFWAIARHRRRKQLDAKSKAANDDTDEDSLDGFDVEAYYGGRKSGASGSNPAVVVVAEDDRSEIAFGESAASQIGDGTLERRAHPPRRQKSRASGKLLRQQLLAREDADAASSVGGSSVSWPSPLSSVDEPRIRARVTFPHLFPKAGADSPDSLAYPHAGGFHPSPLHQVVTGPVSAASSDSMPPITPTGSDEFLVSHGTGGSTPAPGGVNPHAGSRRRSIPLLGGDNEDLIRHHSLNRPQQFNTLDRRSSTGSLGLGLMADAPPVDEVGLQAMAVAATAAGACESPVEMAPQVAFPDGGEAKVDLPEVEEMGPLMTPRTAAAVGMTEPVESKI